MELNIVAPPKPRRNSASRKHKSSHGKRSRTSTHKHASGGPGESSSGSHARNGTKRDHKTGHVYKGGSKSVQRGRAPNAKRPRPSDNAGQDTDTAGTGATKRPRTAGEAASDAAPAGTATGRGTRRNPVRLEPQRVSMIVDVADAAPITATAAKAAAGAGNGGGAGAGASRPGGQLVLGAARGIQGTGRIFRDGGTFGELGVSDQLVLQLTDRMKLKQPTQCQRLTVPVGLSGRDVMLKSETGSGKTLAFLLPIVHQLLALPQRCSRTDGTRAIILAPTRELCQQISRVLGDLIAPFRWIVAGSVTGGGASCADTQGPGLCLTNIMLRAQKRRSRKRHGCARASPSLCAPLVACWTTWKRRRASMCPRCVSSCSMKQTDCWTWVSSSR